MVIQKSNQFEDFEPQGQIINNLERDEKVIYKLKSEWIPDAHLGMIFVSVDIFTLTINILFFFEGIINFDQYFKIFFNFLLYFIFYCSFFSISLFFHIYFPRSIQYYLPLKYMRKSFDNYLYLTNKRIILIEDDFSHIKSIILDYTNIQGLSFSVKKNYFSNQINGFIEFISMKGDISDRSRFIYPIFKDFIQIRTILDSILWYYGNSSERLKKIKLEYQIELPKEIIDTKYHKVLLYENKIAQVKSYSYHDIEFKSDFYMNFRYEYHKFFIIIKSSFNVKNRIKFKIENYPIIMESIYLQFLAWENEQKKLLSKEYINTLGLKPSYLERPND